MVEDQDLDRGSPMRTVSRNVTDAEGMRCTGMLDPTQGACVPALSQAAASADARLSAAVAARLALRKQFYQALLRLRGRTKQDLDAAAKHLARAAAELEAVRASADLGAVAADAEDAAWAPLGFDSALNAQLAPPMPPRVCKVRAWVCEKRSLFAMNGRLCACANHFPRECTRTAGHGREQASIRPTHHTSTHSFRDARS